VLSGDPCSRERVAAEAWRRDRWCSAPPARYRSKTKSITPAYGAKRRYSVLSGLAGVTDAPRIEKVGNRIMKSSTKCFVFILSGLFALVTAMAFILSSLLVLVATPAASARRQADPSPPQVEAAQQTSGQLQQLVAPIALYPDNLVGQVLAAATYPAQVVQAERWMQAHLGLKGTDLAQAVDQQPWDASVKALTEFPKVLANMDKNLAWTSALGDAYINQQQDVMNAIQTMRQRARSSGNLQTTTEQTVTDQGQTIVIQPADPQIVYVPEYDPWACYGGMVPIWPGWAPYPGLYLAGPGIEFGVGYGFGFYTGFGWGWNGWGVDWQRHDVMFNHGAFVSRSPTFINRANFARGRTEFNSAAGSRAGFAGGSNASYHRTSTPGAGSGVRSSAFSGFDHGGIARTYSARGRASVGGASRGGGGGGGFRGGGGGSGSRGGGRGGGGS
jgi:hypothetical protein